MYSYPRHNSIHSFIHSFIHSIRTNHTITIKPMCLVAHFLQLLLLIAALGCCSSSSVEVPSSTTQEVDVEQYMYEQYETDAMVQSRQDDRADNIFMIGQSRGKGRCSETFCKKKDCHIKADVEKKKCKKRKKRMKQCCKKSCDCDYPKRGCDWSPTQIDSITKRRERKRLKIARKAFSEAFGDTYSFQFTSRINATTNVYSIAVVDSNLVMTDDEKWCYPVSEKDDELKLCNILAIGDLFDIISIGIKNHPTGMADLYTYDQIVLRSVRYGQLGQPKAIVLEPLSTSISSCHPIITRTRQFRFGRG